MQLRNSIIFAMWIVCAAATFAQPGPPGMTPKSDDAYVPLKKCWEYSIQSGGQVSVAASHGTVYLAESGGKVRSLDARTGQVNWVTELGGNVSALQAVPRLGIAVITAGSNTGGKQTLRLLTADSGLVNYASALDAGGEIFLFSKGSRLISVGADGRIAAFNAQTGESLWQLNLNAKLTADPAISDRVLAVATEEKKIVVISLATGKSDAGINFGRVVTAVTIRENDMIVVGDDRGNVTNFRDSSGSVWWKFKSGARIGAIRETQEGLLVGSYDNFLYLLSKYSGDVRWKRRLDGRIVSPPALMDGYLLTAASTESTAQAIDIQTGKPVDQINFGDDRFMLSQPLVVEPGMTVFPLIDGIAAYSSSVCPAK